MKTKIITTLVSLIICGSAIAESKTPYDPILKASAIKKQITIDNQKFIRAYLKPISSDLDINSVELWIERNDQILKKMKPTLRIINENSLSKEYPWEILLPIGEEYSNGTKLVHNLEPGGLSFTLSASIKVKGPKAGEINND